MSGPILRRRSPPYCCESDLAVSLRSRACRSLLRLRRSSISLRAACVVKTKSSGGVQSATAVLASRAARRPEEVAGHPVA